MQFCWSILWNIEHLFGRRMSLWFTKVRSWKWDVLNGQVKISWITWEKCLWNFFCLALLVVGDDVDEDLLTFPGVCTTPPAAIDGVLLLSGLESWLKWDKNEIYCTFIGNKLLKQTDICKCIVYCLVYCYNTNAKTIHVSGKIWSFVIYMRDVNYTKEYNVIDDISN